MDSKRIVAGIIIIALGVFLLLSNTGSFIPWFIYRIVISWQSLLIAIGLVLLADKKGDHKTAGIVLILVGTIFLLPKILPVNMKGIVVPLVLIAVGVVFIIKAATKRTKLNNIYHYGILGKGKKQFTDFEKSATTNQGGVVHKEYVFSGSKEKWTQGKLNKLSIEAVFSGVELDLSQAELADDIKVAAHIQIKSVFSGVILYVPDDWNIMVQKDGAFGGFSDKRPNRVLKNTSDKLVVMELEAVFGGGEIRCYE